MGRNNRRGRGRRNWNNQNGQKNDSAPQPTQALKPVFHRTVHENPEDVQKRDQAIRDLKARKVVCAKCGLPITDMTTALADRETGAPVHFDCVLEELKKTEKLDENDRMTYIGQGRFAVLHFDNPRDMRQFKIVKIIEWEQRDKSYDWRDEMRGLYSQVL